MSDKVTLSIWGAAAREARYLLANGSLPDAYFQVASKMLGCFAVMLTTKPQLDKSRRQSRSPVHNEIRSQPGAYYVRYGNCASERDPAEVIEDLLDQSL